MLHNFRRRQHLLAGVVSRDNDGGQVKMTTDEGVVSTPLHVANLLFQRAVGHEVHLGAVQGRRLCLLTLYHTLDADHRRPVPLKRCWPGSF